jgi:hypothetical protein
MNDEAKFWVKFFGFGIIILILFNVTWFWIKQPTDSGVIEDLRYEPEKEVIEDILMEKNITEENTKDYSEEERLLAFEKIKDDAFPDSLPYAVKMDITENHFSYSGIKIEDVNVDEEGFVDFDCAYAEITQAKVDSKGQRYAWAWVHDFTDVSFLDLKDYYDTLPKSDTVPFRGFCYYYDLKTADDLEQRLYAYSIEITKEEYDEGTVGMFDRTKQYEDYTTTCDYMKISTENDTKYFESGSIGYSHLNRIKEQSNTVEEVTCMTYSQN